MQPDLTEKHKALVEAMTARVTASGNPEHKAALPMFTKEALLGTYIGENPIGPDSIGLTQEEFTALRALIYG